MRYHVESKPIHGKDDDIDDRLIGDSGSASPEIVRKKREGASDRKITLDQQMVWISVLW